MSSYINQAYKKTTKLTKYYSAPHEMLSDAFIDAAAQMKLIAQACQDNQFERRANLSEKITITLNGIIDNLDANYNRGPKSIPLYMQAINNITRGLSQVNIKNDGQKALQLSDELIRLGELIRD